MGYAEKMWDKNLGEDINPYRHYRIAKKLYDKYPGLHGKVLLGLKYWNGEEIKVVCEKKGNYQLSLHEKSSENNGGLLESMGAEIKKNPMSLN